MWVRRGWMTWLDYWLASWWGVRAWFTRRPPARWSEGDRDPVVLLPGVYERWSYLLRIGERLHDEGHPVHVVPGLRRNVAPIPARRRSFAHDSRNSTCGASCSSLTARAA